MEKTEILKKASELSEKGIAFILITVTETKGSSPSVVGGKMILTAEGKMYGTVGGGTLEKMALKEAESIFDSGNSLLKKYVLDEEKVSDESEMTGMLCGGEVNLFFEYIGTLERIIIFGAGHIGKVLFRFLKELNFKVSVLDDREKPDDLPDNMKIIFYKGMEDALEKAENLKNSYVVIASHSHELDYKILKSIILKGVNPLYTGVVASKKKIEKMLLKLDKELGGIPDTSSIFSPAGIDIGGASPSEIALSIAAEIQTIRYKKRNFGHLSKVPGTDK